MGKFSKTWKSSKNRGKQRKYRLNAPLHVKQKLMHSHLSKDLRKKYRRRSIGLRKGDKVKMMKGQFRKYEGKIERIDLMNIRVFVNGIETTKKDGTKKLLALRPSSLMITELNLDDKFRQKLFERK